MRLAIFASLAALTLILAPGDAHAQYGGNFNRGVPQRNFGVQGGFGAHRGNFGVQRHFVQRRAVVVRQPVRRPAGPLRRVFGLFRRR